ncbi:aminodeoxychorismate synthase, component I [Terrimicrobium sacchariphilum]|uniref:Aminodeoxychorismate synthase, component I n=1 Tax=Terrimicrobium sacchariphilum TaxID=690879 RepID=A0A146GBV0_TERSA|nr:aminodeoxychorismate synthase, component I [Terrimicrobium sacchariphilum]
MDAALSLGDFLRVAVENPKIETPDLIDAARALRSKSGFVCLEDGMPGPQSFSLLAAEPDLVMSGNLESWSDFEAELSRRAAPSADLGIPTGAAIGWVGFDGSYRFGFYDQPSIYHHGRGVWLTNPPAEETFTPTGFSRPEWRHLIGRDEFVSMVTRAKDYIAAGDIYQVCLAQALECDFAGDPWEYYESLRHHSPAPYSAFLDLGDCQVVSASPECFLRMNGRRIITRPIKGTRPRRMDQQLDQRNAYDLLTSPKEIAELVMITDLERNDLGRVCDYGSVSVPELLKLESFQHVHHLVSTVHGILREDVSQPAALRECFPGGSISGAPKKRALEIIAELEPHPRGIYTGAIGYFGYNGESQFSIAIRTAVFENGRGSFHSGAGIVADSEPEAEWQETLDKAATLLLPAEGR